MRSEGWIILTEDRFIFQRSGPLFNFARLLRDHGTDIERSSVSAMRRENGAAWDKMPFMPILAVDLADGATLRFQVLNPDQYIEVFGERGIA